MREVAQSGTVNRQKRDSGNHNYSKVRLKNMCRIDNAKAFVLMYSLGDEMYGPTYS